MYASLAREDEQLSSVAHDCDHGFCSVCGMVWPCSRARRLAIPVVYPIPTARLPVTRS